MNPKVWFRAFLPMSATNLPLAVRSARNQNNFNPLVHTTAQTGFFCRINCTEI